MRIAVQLAVAAGVALLGAATGTMTALLHSTWFFLAWALAATATSAYALPPRWYARLPYAVGWVAVIIYLSTPRTEGDYLFGRDATDYVVVYAATPLLLLACVLSVAWAAARRPAGTPGESTIDG